MVTGRSLPPNSWGHSGLGASSRLRRRWRQRVRSTQLQHRQGRHRLMRRGPRQLPLQSLTIAPLASQTGKSAGPLANSNGVVSTTSVDVVAQPRQRRRPRHVIVTWDPGGLLSRSPTSQSVSRPHIIHPKMPSMPSMETGMARLASKNLPRAQSRSSRRWRKVRWSTPLRDSMQTRMASCTWTNLWVCCDLGTFSRPPNCRRRWGQQHRAQRPHRQPPKRPPPPPLLRRRGTRGAMMATTPSPSASSLSA
mmetsp:Transcript_31028/g.85502  ORF Transcript_31028/g.85502 Transcript_31028/m.85502 type:complete len:250 (+) Transcript_31028:888-1637(+)